MGHPGTLPVANKEAIRHVLRVGLALGGELADFTEFDRKNYFYPDLPKGYQISQYQYPLVSGGSINGVRITRVHLEEDTARSQHDSSGSSIIDFNRSGLPLMELVTEPVIHDAVTARTFAEELQRVLRALEAGEANMEKGQMRVEANISVSESEVLGTKVEVKNLNSFRSVERAIEFEIRRQIEALEAGDVVLQETRGWDESAERTYAQRVKESSNDYRYFPDPDIPKLNLSRLSEFSTEILRKTIPELPWTMRARYISAGIDKSLVEILVNDSMYAEIFDKHIDTMEDDRARRIAYNYLLSTLRGKAPAVDRLLAAAPSIPRAALMAARGELSSAALVSALDEVMNSGEDIESVVERMALKQVHDGSYLEKIAQDVIQANEKVASDYREGKVEALKYLVGQGMKISKGSAHPSKLEEALVAVLNQKR